MTDISGLEPDDIKDDTGLADIGIDSLMGMEPVRETDNVFECSLDPNDLKEAVDVQSLVKFVVDVLKCDFNESVEDTDKSTVNISSSGTNTTPSISENTCISVGSSNEDLKMPRYG